MDEITVMLTLTVYLEKREPDRNLKEPALTQVTSSSDGICAWQTHYWSCPSPHTLQKFSIKWSIEHDLTSAVASLRHIHFTAERLGTVLWGKRSGSNLNLNSPQFLLILSAEIQVWTFLGVWAALAPRVRHANYSFKVILLKAKFQGV